MTTSVTIPATTVISAEAPDPPVPVATVAASREIPLPVIKVLGVKTKPLPTVIPDTVNSNPDGWTKVLTVIAAPP